MIIAAAIIALVIALVFLLGGPIIPAIATLCIILLFLLGFLLKIGVVKLLAWLFGLAVAALLLFRAVWWCVDRRGMEQADAAAAADLARNNRTNLALQRTWKSKH